MNTVFERLLVGRKLHGLGVHDVLVQNRADVLGSSQNVADAFVGLDVEADCFPHRKHVVQH